MPSSNCTREGRRGLLHRDGVGRRIMARKRARITAITGGGAIPDVADYQVLQEPEGMFVGTLNEDFAVESNVGDIFQLGNTSWRILKVERGAVRVADAQGQPPSIPFWLGEGPSRTAELSAEIGSVREECGDPRVLARGDRPGARSGDADRRVSSATAGACWAPCRRRSASSSSDSSTRAAACRWCCTRRSAGGSTAPGAWRCASASAAASVSSCRPPPTKRRSSSRSACSTAFRWKMSSTTCTPTRSKSCSRRRCSISRCSNRAGAGTRRARWCWSAFRTASRCRRRSCGCARATCWRRRFPRRSPVRRTCPPGDLPIPMEHPLVRQTIDDCLTEATDVAGLIEVLKGLRDGSIERVAVDTAEPSAFARGILNSEPYTFLDDAPLEERRTQAVLSRRALDARSLDGIGALDPAAVERVREEAWPQPESAEEVHDALLWMGFVTDDEAIEWLDWLSVLANQVRVVSQDGRWFAVDGPTEPKQILLGRLEALGPVAEDDPRIAVVSRSPDPAQSLTVGLPASNGDLRSEQWHGRETMPQQVPLLAASSGSPTALLAELEHDGAILRTRLDGAPRGASAGCWPAFIATRSNACAARSSRSPPANSCSSSPAGSTSMKSSDWKVRAASPKSCSNSPASKSPPGRGSITSCRAACATIAASGSTK